MAWLASELARRERPLRAGDVVLSGGYWAHGAGESGRRARGECWRPSNGLRAVRLEARHLYGSPISPACNASEEASYVAAATFMIDRFRRSLIV